MKILIVYGTTEGQTRKISRFMEDVLTGSGHKVAVADASEEPPTPNDYDAVLIGGSLHAHKYQSALTHYIKKKCHSLKQNTWCIFFCLSCCCFGH